MGYRNADRTNAAAQPIEALAAVRSRTEIRSDETMPMSRTVRHCSDDNLNSGVSNVVRLSARLIAHRAAQTTAADDAWVHGREPEELRRSSASEKRGGSSSA
jgi:hypothetical protein